VAAIEVGIVRGLAASRKSPSLRLRRGETGGVRTLPEQIGERRRMRREGRGGFATGVSPEGRRSNRHRHI
jgi:hypothetical protein